jgi:S-adenosylmethionine hydrolase
MATESRPSGIITLLTDFGLQDPFVGVMKGVILTRFPEAKIVDLAHGVRPQDVRECSFWLARSYGWFPRGTVHVAVVDPGVGSERGTLVLQADGHWFVGPDNGVMDGVFERSGDADAREIDVQRFGLAAPSRTFHGRDVFAPVAAELAAGRCAFDAVGPVKQSAVGLCGAQLLKAGDSVQGRVVSVDHFGNLITDIDAGLLTDSRLATVRVADTPCPIRRCYSDAEPGGLLALINAFGTLEIACRDASAAEILGVGRGAMVTVRLSAKV